ncbi:MAG: PepSY-associated TM helix domain-containing protein [Planctomycetes bacterium]|nr:PepSY-associated TM helix domain-containing protein [Planctomycetota bacterium]
MAKKFPWRRWVRVIHRDLGYLCVGLTIVYGISGVAVNHVGDWNPSYAIERTRSEIGALTYDVPVKATTVHEVLDRLELPRKHDSTFQPDPDHLRIFQKGDTIDVNLKSGSVVRESVTTRPVIHESNVLHLNHPKKLWTWIADGFAVSLILLALTGMFILTGRQGLKGRGKWFVAAGVAIPLIALWIYL